MPVEVQTLAEWEAAGVPGLLSIVMPAHNEEGHIEGTLRAVGVALDAAGIDHELLVVDDNSRDGTRAILDRLRHDMPRLRVVANPPPNGYGLAVRRGLSEFRGEAVAIVMADGSDRPEDIVAFWRRLQEGVDCVFGSRFAPGGRVVDYPLPKRVLNRLGNTLIRVLFGIANNDVTNAFKMYRRGVIAGILPLLSRHFNLTVEMPLKAVVRGHSYATVPNHWINRKAGVSKFNIKEMGSRYFFVVAYCLIEKWLSRGDFRPSNENKASSLQVWPR